VAGESTALADAPSGIQSESTGLSHGMAGNTSWEDLAQGIGDSRSSSLGTWQSGAAFAPNWIIPYEELVRIRGVQLACADQR
jgi:hypothetical protein